jgi:SAM-dependent methyltransferase
LNKNPSKIGARKGADPLHYHRSPISFLLYSVVIQASVVAVVVAGAHMLAPVPSAGASAALGIFCVVLGCLATSVGWGLAVFLKLPTPWRILNALLIPLVVVSQLLAIPGWLYSVCAAAGLLLYLPTTWSRVPYYPSSRAMYEAVLQELPSDHPVRFVDLGCGSGGLLCFLARHRPESTFVGVELSPLAFCLAWVQVKLAGVRNVSLEFRDLWRISLSDFAVVYAFLAPPPMQALWEKVSRELPPGGLFLVNSFPVPGILAKEIAVPGERQVTLYRYDMLGR